MPLSPATLVEFAERATRSHRVALYARGHNAALAAAYAIPQAQGSVPEWAVLREGFVTFRHFIERTRSLEASYRLLDDDAREARMTAFDREIPPN